MRKIIIPLTILIVILSSILMASCNKVYDNYSDSVTTYSLDENGEFKILTLSDTHFMNDNSDEDNAMLLRIQQLIEYSNPDLIVFLGDIVYSDTSRVDALSVFVNLIDAYKIPWACVYGNHDPESSGSISNKSISIDNKQAMNAVLLASEYCVFEVGPEDIDGFGNYIINITGANNKIVETLFFLDSGDYVRAEDVVKYGFPTQTSYLYKNYGTLFPSQVSWYENTVKDLSHFVYKDKQAVPSIAFFHIPLPEYKTVWELYQAGSSEVTFFDGGLHEINVLNNGGVTSPSVNTGMFNKMVELGSTKAVYVGHDHANDFSIAYKGITFNYNGGLRNIDYLEREPGTVESLFGGRVVTIKENGIYTTERILSSTLVTAG